MPAATETRKRTAPAVRHLDGCPEKRLEMYETAAPSGPHMVTRCIECGEAIVVPIDSDTKEA